MMLDDINIKLISA